MCMGHLSHDDHVSQSHFSFSQWLVLRSWGCVLLFRFLSLGYLLCRHVTFVTCRDRESCWLFFCSQKFWFWLENTMYCLCMMMRLFTIDGCGDYRQVWCVAFFSTTSIGLHFGIHCQSSKYSQSHLGWHFRMLFRSSKLKARKSLFPETWQKRPSSFELWAFENVTPSGIIMIFIFTILLIQTYIQINYYYDKNHANSMSSNKVYSTSCGAFFLYWIRVVLSCSIVL